MGRAICAIGAICKPTVLLYSKADLFKIGDPSSEQNGTSLQSLILKSQFTFGGQYNISKNTVGLTPKCILH